MKRYLLSLATLVCLALGVQAQNQMHVNMKNGSKMNIFVSEIESVTWDTIEEGSGDNNPDDPTVTGDALNITGNSATIVGYANNVRDNESTDLKIGIIYCTEGTPNKSNGVQKTVSKSQVAADGKYTINLTGLSRGTTYYYRSFVYQSGLWFYGKVRSFSTVGQDVSATFQTGAATNVTCFSAKVSAQMKLTTTLSYSSMSYGICYGTVTEPTEKLQVSTKDSNGNYTATLRALTGNTIYYYRPYVIVDGVTYYGQTSSFKTLEDNVVTTGEIDANGHVRCRLTIGGGAYSTLEVGLCWAKGKNLPTVNDNSAKTNELDDENYYVITPSLSAGTNYYRAYVKIDGVAHYGAVKSVEKTVNTNGLEYVDLGLSVKWANMNVGASSPEEYGDYFAWGETQPKSNYNWSTYKWCNGSSPSMTKYCTFSDYGTVDNKTTLELSDDAAHVNWGGNWRMPTEAEQDELRNTNNCTWTWTIQNGVNGYKVTSKKNGNSIFLPAAGSRDDSSLYNAGSRGFYMSSSLNKGGSYYACCLYFDSGGEKKTIGSRDYGHPVRAVCQ